MEKKSLSIRIEKALLHKLHIMAANNDRSANNQILILIRDSVEQFEKKHGKIELN